MESEKTGRRGRQTTTRGWLAAEDLLKVLKPIAVRRWRAVVASARYDAKPKANRRSEPDEQSEVRQEIERTSCPGAPSAAHGAPRAQESDEAIGAETEKATGRQPESKKIETRKKGPARDREQDGSTGKRLVQDVWRKFSDSPAGADRACKCLSTFLEVVCSWRGRWSDSSVAMLRVRQMRLLCVRQDGRGLWLLPL